MLKEFKEFINRGSVMDMAIGLIMATYFGAIVKSFVSDVLMPPLGELIGGVSFTDMKYVISEAVVAADGTIETPEVAVRYGAFIDTIVTFIIVAFAIFMVIRSLNKMKKKKEEAPAAPPAPSKEEVLLTEIRDAIRKQNG